MQFNENRVKKVLFVLVIFLLIAGGTWLGIFYLKNLRGIQYAVQKPTDIISTFKSNPPQGSSPTFPLKLPKGFSISLFAQGLGDPRVLVFDPNGALVVSIPSQGKVIAFKAGETITVADNLNQPHGLAFNCTAI